MKKVTLLCGLLLAISASVAAAAQGVGLRWNDCIGDGGALNKNFACTSNAGTNVLAGTFELGADLLNTSGEEIVIDLASASSPLPAWWQFKNAGTCRTGSMGISASALLSSVNCADWGGGLAGAGLGAYIVGGAGPNTARIVAASAVPPSGLQALVSGQEYFAFQLTINNAKTVGTGNCAGCTDAVCIVFNSLNMTTPVLANNVKITGPSNGTDSNFCTWQGGAGVVTQRGIGCPLATPTQNKTWSQVKGLYR